MKIKMIVEKTRTGYSAYADKYPVYTAGADLDELKSNIVDALNLNFEEEGKLVREEDIRIVLDLPQFFEFYKVINAKALSERIGMIKACWLSTSTEIKSLPMPKTNEY